MQLYRSHVLVCAGTGCHASESPATKEALINELAARGLDQEIQVVDTGCFGFCQFGPNIMVYPEGVFYTQVHPQDVKEVVEEHFLKGRVVERLLYKEPDTEAVVKDFTEIPFFKHQVRIALHNCGIIDPESIDEYIARDGYQALGKVLTTMTAAEVIDEIKKSGLRGRGGGGFPTGVKWEFAHKQPPGQKYIVCNADEGDPGAFMDRSILEGDPHSIVEGMTIGGYAIGASKGFVYCRAEYPIAVNRLKLAISQAKEKGLLGQNIFNSGFDFDLEIRLGAGAFVCGEETALLASIEGRRGEPRPRPPFPAVSGLWGKPTIINNVETFANIATIIRKGWEWFTGIGTEKSKGTKVFALAGKINNNGLAEIPMGTPLGEVIYDIGGGIPDGKKFKAAQTGGPSGGCIPPEHLNTPIDYDSLTALGTIMGSGGLVIMDEDTCMVDLAKFFLDFVKDESCGKCTPCRIGTTRMLEILERISKGEGKEEDIDLLEELGKQIKTTALCGLGQTAPNPVLSTLRYFREEYLEHIRDKHCRASVCATLFDSPCQNTCPANVDVPIYVDLIRQGRFAEAYETIRNENPLPVVCGRVCHHPCEGKCNRAKLDEAVAIRELKMFAADQAMQLNGQRPKPQVAPPNGKKVAIVGAGPAGLTAAYYLAIKGYSVTIYEALPVAGGMLAVGIPEYRLPKKTLQAEIDTILELGVELKLNQALGRDFTIEDLKTEGYDAIYLAIGAHKDQHMGLEGEDLQGVYAGVTFLRELNLGQELNVKDKTVAVIGGGNVAMDAARSSLRLGAKEVHILYRRQKEDMPALEEEIEEAEKEGIKISCQVNPVAILGQDGQVTAVKCARQSMGEFDRSGRRRPVAIAGSEFDLPVDIVIAAIGYQVDPASVPADMEVTRWGTIVADAKACRTNIEGVFASGDCVSGPDTVVGAIAAGKQAAAAVDQFLDGDGVVVPQRKIVRERTAPVIEEKTARLVGQSLDLEKRLQGFAEVELGYDEQQAIAEAARCLRCDVRD